MPSPQSHERQSKLQTPISYFCYDCLWLKGLCDSGFSHPVFLHSHAHMICQISSPCFMSLECMFFLGCPILPQTQHSLKQSFMKNAVRQSFNSVILLLGICPKKITQNNMFFLLLFVFNRVMHSCNPCPDQNKEYYEHLRTFSLCPLPIIVPPKVTVGLTSVIRLIWPIFELHLNRIYNVYSVSLHSSIHDYICENCPCFCR